MKKYRVEITYFDVKFETENSSILYPFAESEWDAEMIASEWFLNEKCEEFNDEERYIIPLYYVDEL